MKLSALIEDVETKGFDVTNCTVDNGNCTLSFRETESHRPQQGAKVAAISEMEIKAISRRFMRKPELFSSVREWCNMGDADKYISTGDQILIPSLHIPETNCEGEVFKEIDLKDVVVTAVHVEPRRVVFNFDDILFRHDIDEEESGKPFEETPLGVYLAKHFAEAINRYTGDVSVSLLSYDNVFNGESKDFMSYFKPIKNRIKVLADENDTWYWWLKTPSSSSAADFCGVHHYGYSYYFYASYGGGGVAPAFEITSDKYRTKRCETLWIFCRVYDSLGVCLMSKIHCLTDLKESSEKT